MKTVWVIGNEMGYVNMFLANGWDVVDNMYDADFVQFTGGADVSPELYGEELHPTTHHSPVRDHKEMAIFEEAVTLGKGLLGICRGAQFLNVMSGGSLWQNVNGHTIGGTHLLTDVLTKEEVEVSSTHHQMMRKGNKGVFVATAAGFATKKESDTEVVRNSPVDTEVVWYEDTKALCFQPHPEFFEPDHPCQAYYFKLINRMFGE
ncbi:MAG: hypothetical protein GQ574_14770 [Crocinitomix sp.]|nr:hypothetical protein [Crocinitomix sp.]